MIDFKQLENDLVAVGMGEHYSLLAAAVEKRLEEYTHGEMSQWQHLIDHLPDLAPSSINLKENVRIGEASDLSQDSSISKDAFISQLKQLHPWRKGPFELFGIHIDTEWRSDWKWHRLLPHISPLKYRSVLDVGCGNGYHCFRMLGEGAKFVLGIDPSQKFLAQFSVFKKYLKEQPVHLLPIGIEHLPQELAKPGFDTVFSMGVLYHRKSPINHLLELKNLMHKDGELVLETLVVDGDENTVLVPTDRYAQMRNVWFIPSVKALERWMRKCGFRQVKTVDVNQTTTQEQRATDWMVFHSLSNYLDPKNPNKTVEGYPAPKRAMTIARI